MFQSLLPSDVLSQFYYGNLSRALIYWNLLCSFLPFFTVCGDPPVPGNLRNLTINLLGNVLVATYSCINDSYQIIGGNTLICGVNKSWNGTGVPGKCLQSES